MIVIVAIVFSICIWIDSALDRYNPQIFYINFYNLLSR